MLFDWLFNEQDKLACPYCGERFSSPGVDTTRVHAEKKSWLFYSDNPVMPCPNCRELIELVKNSAWW